jgi:reactive chlorine resistance protein C
MKNLGSHLSIIGLATVLIWIGLFKFTPTEAKAIEPLVASSPVMRWLYHYLSVQQVSNLIGSIEVLTGLLILANYFTTYGGLLGGFLATVTFLTTLSFIFTSPGGIQQIDNFVLPDGFILKDLMALGISVDLFWRAYTAIFRAPKS